MPGPNKRWDDEEEEETSSSAESTTPPTGAVAGAVRRNKFEDEEDDSDVVDDWDAAEDSEVEREKAKKAAEAKAKADAEAAAKKKPKAKRIEDRIAERKAREAEEDESDDDETEAQRRERLRRTEKESDLRHAEDLFADVGISNSRKAVMPGSAVMIDAKDPNNTIDLSALPLFKPSTKTQFEQLRNTLVPIITSSNKKPHYALFLQEFAKQLAKDLPSDQIKKVASTLTTLSNEKMKEEKAAEKGGKKSKAQKTKTTLAGVSRAAVDTNTYEDTYNDENDFM